MSLTLKLGSTSTDLDNSSDLIKFLTSNPAAELTFLGDLTQINNTTLKDLGNKQVSLTFNTSKQIKWDLGGSGGVTFGFSPSAGGTVSIDTTGTLFTYKLNEDSDPVNVPIPANTGYVSVTFNMSLGVSAEATVSSGNFGVSGNASASSTFAISFRKAFPLSTNAIDAITQTFQAFTLPFQPAGISQLKNGDYSDYEYLGTIKAGFGLTYGVTTNLLAGRSKGEISQSFNLSPLAKAVVNFKPTLDAAGSFKFAYDHEDTFRVIVARQDTSAELIYFRTKSNSISTTETLGITLSAGASFNLSSSVASTATTLAQSAFSSMPAALKSQATTTLTDSLVNKFSGVVQQHIDDVNTSINGLLSKADGQTIQLQLEQERLTTNTALFKFHFDLSQTDALDKGYPAAIKGDFVTAIQVNGVTLDSGAFVENYWKKSSSVSFQFFDLFKVAEVTDYFKDCKLVYLGQNKFRFLIQTGVEHSVTFQGKKNSCEVFFSASASTSAEVTNASDLQVVLNFNMVDESSDAAQETKRALTFIGGAALGKGAAAIPNNLLGSLTVNCQFPQSAFGKLKSDSYVKGKPTPLPHVFDKANYQAFMDAVKGIVPSDRIEEEFLRLFASYESWTLFNLAKIDRDGSTKPPDRLSVGNEAVNIWPASINEPDDSIRAGLQCYLYSAQGFMNLCDGLKGLGTDDLNNFNGDFNNLTTWLNKMIKQNINVYFVKPTLAALFRMSLGSSSDLQVTQSGGNIAISFTANVAEAAASRTAARAA